MNHAIPETPATHPQWRIVSNYKTLGLSWTIKHEAKRIRSRLDVNAVTARRMALVTVRVQLSKAIDSGVFYAVN